MKDANKNTTNRIDIIKQAAERVNQTVAATAYNYISALDAQFINEMKKRMPDNVKVIW